MKKARLVALPLVRVMLTVSWPPDTVRETLRVRLPLEARLLRPDRLAYVLTAVMYQFDLLARVSGVVEYQ